MTEKVTIERRDDMPMPLNLLAGPEDLAAWYREGLLESLEQGERALAIACFDTEGAFNLNLAAQAAASATRPMVVSAIITFTGSPLVYWMFSSKSFLAAFAIAIVCSSRPSRTFRGPRRPSMVGRMPITGYSPMYLFFAISILLQFLRRKPRRLITKQQRPSQTISSHFSLVSLGGPA